MTVGERNLSRRASWAGVDVYKRQDLQEMCYWHALPSSWHRMGYETFLESRRQLIAHVTRDGFTKLN